MQYDLFGPVPRRWAKQSMLNYVGGKSRAKHIIRHYFPKELTSMVSPFFGGGHIEIACAFDNIQVHGYDLYDDLVNFWQQLQIFPHLLSEIAKKYYPMDRKKFAYLFEIYDKQDDVTKATLFWIFHKSTFRGAGFRDKWWHEKRHTFNPSQIAKLGKFYNPNFSVSKADFEESLANHPGLFAYLDPPYPMQGKNNFYGRNGELHSEFDHERLCHVLKQRDSWILSYNNNDMIKDLYASYRIEYPTWAYGRGSDHCDEILIINT